MTVPVSQSPRNPLVVKAMFRLAGSHSKSRKAVRRNEKIKLVTRGE